MLCLENVENAQFINSSTWVLVEPLMTPNKYMNFLTQKLNLKNLLLNSKGGGIKPRHGRGRPKRELVRNWANGKIFLTTKDTMHDGIPHNAHHNLNNIY